MFKIKKLVKTSLLTFREELVDVDDSLYRTIARYNGNMSAIRVKEAIESGLRVYTSLNHYEAAPPWRA